MTEAQLRKIVREVVDQSIEQNNAVLFGQMSRHFDKKLDEQITPLKEEMSQIRTMLDRDAKRLETDEQERIIMGGQLTRHRTWIDQLAKATHTKLIPEQ